MATCGGQSMSATSAIAPAAYGRRRSIRCLRPPPCRGIGLKATSEFVGSHGLKPNSLDLLLNYRGGRINGVLGGAVPVRNIPPMACLRLDPSGSSACWAERPPTDGLRGMIEGRLGRRTGVNRGGDGTSLDASAPFSELVGVPTGSG